MLPGRYVRGREKRGDKVGKTKRGKGSKVMLLVDGNGTPLGVHVDSASPAEVRLVQQTLDTLPEQGHPERIVADLGYDSNPLRAALWAQNIQPVIPARRNSRKATDQDGRCLRRYRRRWKVERTNAWLQNFRRLYVRYERHAYIFLAMVQLVCMLITLRRVVG
jgi:transposase